MCGYGSECAGGHYCRGAIDTVLVDVAPHSLGIEVARWDLGTPMFDQYNVIIGRNTPVPVSKSEVFTTFSPNQRTVEIKVYQGEESIASQNTFLGDFLLEGVKRTKRRRARDRRKLRLRFKWDVRVSAQDKQTGREEEIAVAASPDRLTEGAKNRSYRTICGYGDRIGCNSDRFSRRGGCP